MVSILEAQSVTRKFQLGNRFVTALEPVSIGIEMGQFLVITGSSGSGKSTLLNLLSGLDKPSSGSVLYKGAELNGLNETELATIRNREFGFIFQTPHLLMDRTVLENVALPSQYGPISRNETTIERCMNLLEYVGLAELAHRFPNTLSGGEMQRVVFARALLQRPNVIFADEPTGSLDAKNSRNVLKMLKDQAASGRTVVMVTHDQNTACYASDQLQLDKFAGE